MTYKDNHEEAAANLQLAEEAAKRDMERQQRVQDRLDDITEGGSQYSHDHMFIPMLAAPLFILIMLGWGAWKLLIWWIA